MRQMTTGNMARGALGLMALAALGLCVWLITKPEPPVAARATVIGLAPEQPAVDQDFARAYKPREFNFPTDHGPHPEFQTEWWYYTGNAQDANGRHFGYQLTFFRRALLPPADAPRRASDLAASQIYFAHFGVTDSAANQHVSFEKFSRGAGGLAGASGEPFKVYLEDWSTTGLNTQGDAVRLIAQSGAYSLTLDLHSLKPPVLQGERGLSRKSDIPGNASYYYSFTRLETRGRISTPDGAFDVTGSSWMDHEWSTSALGPNTQGWDWFALQLSDQREVMFYQFRNRDGTIDPISSGVLVQPDGRALTLKRDDVRIEVLETWRSPSSQAEYPVRWRITILSQAISLEVDARIKDQQMNVSVVYWEGAVSIKGQASGAPLSGVGYVELTGYSGTLNGRF
jgi:predicted secreted hydrolase